MKFKTRIFTTLLAVLMMLGSLSVIGTIAVGAADEIKTEEDVAKYYLKTNVFKTPQEKLDTMTLMIQKHGYELYVDSMSGEIALVETATGNYLFSNPYDVASSKGSDQFKTGGNPGTKEQLLMSQIIVNYEDNGNSKTLYSFQDAAVKGQINVSRIKSGVRVEYTIGREEFRKLVPRWIPAETFDELIKKPLLEAVTNGAMDGIPAPTSSIPYPTAEDNFYYKQFMTYYQLKDPELEETQGGIDAMYKAYPITKEMPIYVFTSDASAVEINKVEGYIKQYCADTYSFEQMDIDHETTGYEATDEEYPVFKMALEYSLDENGLSVRMPCNSLQYNASSYTLENISILPYMGAGNTKNDGYNFYPDGAGSLFDFNLTKQNSVRASIYGIDYAYHEISGTYEKAIRVPVYGTVATEVIYSYGYNETVTDAEGNETVEEHPLVEVSNTVMTKEQIEEFLAKDTVEQTAPITERSYKRGYVAIVESGESLGMLETYFAGALSDYATVSNYFNPKPKDQYDIADSISVTSSSTWTVVSNRKYTGDIALRYQLLSDETIGANAQAEAAAKGESYSYYEASWLGMAEAYRDYLVKNGKLTELTDADVETNIPLYMEVFGALETQQTIATIPVDVMTPLTTFENILTMYNELKDSGVKNVNFKMTGFANGGMYSTMPASLKWEGKVGGKSGFEDLVAAANGINDADDENHIGLYPDFDFAYTNKDAAFDGLKLKKDAIKTIDNRYTSKRMYSATQQKYISFYQLAISPSRYSKFYEKLLGNYEQYGLKSMSVASLGTALNTDFDEDEPYNREDNKDFTISAFEDLNKAGYSLMTEGGNAYTWEYVDHIINMELDSSRYVKATASVPFLGAVLHGYIQFAGTPFNEEGNSDYAMLKAIENGAGMYFILSYQNTAELKEDEALSQYYSIRYDIWRNDVVSYYNELNAQLADLQTKKIVSHKFLNYYDTDANDNMYLTDRVLDLDELKQDVQNRLDQAEQEAKDQEKNEAINQIAAVAEARIALQKSITTLENTLKNVEALNKSLSDEYIAFANRVDQAKENATSLMQSDVDQVRALAVKIWNLYEQIEYQYVLADEVIVELEAELEIIRKSKEGTAADYQYQEAKAQLDAAKAYLAKEKQDQLGAYDTITGGDDVFATTVEKMIADVAGIVATYNETNAAVEGFIAIVADLDMTSIKEEAKYVPVENSTTDTTETETEDPFEKYHVTNNSVVAVTYGDIDPTTRVKTAYKTFLLNYNNFAVRVTYNGVVYTIPAGGYVVLMAQN